MGAGGLAVKARFKEKSSEKLITRAGISHEDREIGVLNKGKSS